MVEAHPPMRNAAAKHARAGLMGNFIEEVSIFFYGFGFFPDMKNGELSLASKDVAIGL
jgi:hypothetical protein